MVLPLSPLNTGRDYDDLCPGSPGRCLLQVRAMKYSPVSSPSPLEQMYGSAPASPLPPIRAVTDTFNGRITIPKPSRLATPSRSRRTELGSGFPSGKEPIGTGLTDRLALKDMYIHPPKVPTYVNDATVGSIKLATHQIEAPLTAPKRAEFCRLAVASSKGGTLACQIRKLPDCRLIFLGSAHADPARAGPGLRTKLRRVSAVDAVRGENTPKQQGDAESSHVYLQSGPRTTR